MDGVEGEARSERQRVSTPLDILVPVLMGAALLWWIGRGMGTRAILLATFVTLAVIAGVMLIENRGGP